MRLSVAKAGARPAAQSSLPRRHRSASFNRRRDTRWISVEASPPAWNRSINECWSANARITHPASRAARTVQPAPTTSPTTSCRSRRRQRSLSVQEGWLSAARVHRGTYMAVPALDQIWTDANRPVSWRGQPVDVHLSHDAQRAPPTAPAEAGHRQHASPSLPMLHGRNLIGQTAAAGP